jgi:hypothetical protein
VSAAIDTLVLKLVLTPLLIAGASLAGRRWGQSIGGWLVGLPLTSGPVAFFLAVERGAGFAAAAAVGSLAGAIAEAAFCLAYGWTATRGWVAATVTATLAFAVVALALQWLAWPSVALAATVGAVLVVTLRLLPRLAGGAAPPSPPRWDLPARMVLTTALVIVLTGLAPTLGPRLSGVLATFPVYAAILTVFAHRAGPAPAVRVLRGLLLGLFSFGAFFLVLGAVIEDLGLAGGFAAATAAALVVQAASLAFVVRPGPARA